MQNWLCVHEIQSRLKLSKSLELFSKTTLKNLSFETNLESVAQSVEEWEQFKEKQFSQHLYNFFTFFHFAYFDLKLKRNKRIKFFPENPWNFPAVIYKLKFSMSFPWAFFKMWLALLVLALCPHLMLQFRTIILYEVFCFWDFLSGLLNKGEGWV